MSVEHVAHFRILEKIGEGGAGVVYAAFDEVLERRVALKAIRPSRGLNDAARERFLREARTLSALDHPGICRIHDYLRTPGGDFLVLELVEGRSLSAALADRLPRAQALDLAEQLAAVLASAHRAGFIHHDLKPGNVMVTPRGRIKVLDFGLARRGTEDPRTPGRPGIVAGTLQYMSPEQARGEPVTAATDLFALGLILQELFTGEPGHPRGIDSVELHTRAMAGTVNLSPDLGRDIGALVRALTQTEPEARPRAQQVLERLRWIRGRGRRIARRSLAAAVLLGGGLAWLKYTIDLRRRERQAEELIEYMVVDLREQLVPLGRLEILADLGRRALAYFDAVPRSQWTDEELTRRCQAYSQLGDVLSQQGDRDGAMGFFQPALASAEELTRRDPANEDWVFQGGQLQFYVGQVHYDRGDHASARTYFQAYLDTARALLELDPARPEYRIELAYAKTNLGALALNESRWDEAVGSFEEVVELWRALLAEEPDDLDRKYELADALSWLAQSLEPRGLPRAIPYLREEYALREELHEVQPGNATWEYLRAICLHHLADTLEQTGESTEASRGFDEALSLARALVRRDPSNAEWRRHLGVVLSTQARSLLGREGGAAAEPVSAEARDVLDGLARIDPSNAEWSALAATATLITGEVLHALGEPERALELADDAMERLEAREPGPDLAAETHILRGRALLDLGEPQRARRELEEALAVLDDIPLERRDSALEELRARALVFLDRDDEAAELLDRLEADGRRGVASLRERLEERGAVRR